MLSELYHWHEHSVLPLRLFYYISFRSVGAAATALVVGLLVAPWLIQKLRRFKLAQAFRSQEEVGQLAQLHATKHGTPTMGGLVIYLAVTVSTLLWAELNVYVLTALGTYTALTALGFFDDWLKVSRRRSGGLPGRYKLLFQALLSIVILLVLVHHPESESFARQLWVPFSKEPIVMVMPLLPLGLFLFLVVAGSSNAINLTDGVDGLAIGCTITVTMAYGLMAYATGNYIYANYLLLPFMPGTGELTVLCAALCGAAMAFLWHNAHPAAVFMGDTGSLALGGLIGVIAFMILQPFTLVLIGGVFVMEALSVVLQVASYKLTGKRIFRMAPLHHHFELRGWAETQVVIRFWILSLFFAVAGLATLKLR